MKRKKDKQYRKLTKLVDKELKKISKRKKDGDLIEKKVQCKHCGFTVVFKGTRREHFNCPFCKKELIVSFSEEKPIEMKETKKEKPKEIKKKPKKNFSSISAKIIELLIILIGIYYLRNPTLANIKISFSLILIGAILMFMISDKTKSKKEKTLEKKPISFKKNKKGKLVKEKTKKSSSGFLKRITYYLSYKIAIILILWISILYFITGKNQVEIYFIFIFIGMLISRELTDNLANRSLKHRLDAFIIIFLLAYIVIIFDKIKDILEL